MQFILLTGLNNSGKSTTANKIKNMLEENGNTVAIKSFATPLKNLATKYLSYKEQNKNDERFKLEDFAHDLKTSFGQSLFGCTLLDECDKLHVDYVVVDDLRYVEEYNVISDFFETVVIKLPDIVQIDQLTQDVIRLEKLLSYFKEHEIEIFEMKDREDSSIRNILFGTE